MKTLRPHAAARFSLVFAAALAPALAPASYYTLARETKEDKACVIFDARYPAWTKGVYIATYPHHSRSKEGWSAPYYGGIVSDTNPGGQGQLIQFASWQMGGKDAPAAGIDFVHAGPYMSWQRSTWEGSSGGIKGHWPNDKFKPAQWYRFVHRVWTPAAPAPHLGYAGVWMKSLETGEWAHLATFKFPAELTGFNDMGGFVEFFTGNASEQASVEFGNSYALCGGEWVSECDFSARNHKEDVIRLIPGKGERSVTLETTRTPADPATKRHQETPVVTQKFTLRQPSKPDFLDAARLDAPSAERAGRQLVVRWQVDAKSAPQLGYEIEVFSGGARVMAVAANEPDARQCDILLPPAAAGELGLRMRLRDIFGQTSPEVRFAAARSVPLTPASAAGLTPGLSYRYYESEAPDTWSALPAFEKLTPKRTGTVSSPDITPRLRRTGYAFAFEGYLSIPAGGLYTFNLVTACGARLAIGDKTVIDADGYRSIARYTGSVPLLAGAYPVRVAYYQGRQQELQADDFLQLTWSGPGFATTPVPAAAFAHKPAAKEPVVLADVRLADSVRLHLSTRLAGAPCKPVRVEYYAVNEQFDYFSQQGASSADYFLAATDKPGDRLTVPIWGGPRKVIRARLVYDGNRTVDSPPLVIRDTTPARATDGAGLRLTSLEHHLYPMSRATERDTVTLVGESMGLLTRPVKGDVTLIAHLAGITPDTPLLDGTRLKSSGNWYSGLILRNNLKPRPGEPLGGAEIPYIALVGSADGATRHCDSTMINGAGNQLSGNVGRDTKWFKLTRRGSELAAFISKDGQEWKPVKTVNLPILADEIEAGFIHYAEPSSTPCLHWATFDNIAIRAAVTQ